MCHWLRQEVMQKYNLSLEADPTFQPFEESKNNDESNNNGDSNNNDESKNNDESNNNGENNDESKSKNNKIVIDAKPKFGGYQYGLLGVNHQFYES